MADRLFADAANLPVWEEVGVDVQTGLSEEVRITAITRAKPAVVTYDTTAGVALADGDYVVIRCAGGMAQVHERVFFIENVDDVAGTFELQDEDSTGYREFKDAAFKVIEFGASFSTTQSISVSGGDPTTIDQTTIHDSAQKTRFGRPAATTFQFTNFFSLNDGGFVECRKASLEQTPRAILFTFQGGMRVAAYGSVSCTGAPGGNTGDSVTTPINISCNNLPTPHFVAN